MITIMVILVIFILLGFLAALVTGLIAIAPGFLVIIGLCAIDCFVIVWIFKKIKRKIFKKEDKD